MFIKLVLKYIFLNQYWILVFYLTFDSKYLKYLNDY